MEAQQWLFKSLLTTEKCHVMAVNAKVTSRIARTVRRSLYRFSGKPWSWVLRHNNYQHQGPRRTRDRSTGTCALFDPHSRAAFIVPNAGQRTSNGLTSKLPTRASELSPNAGTASHFCDAPETRLDEPRFVVPRKAWGAAAALQASSLIRSNFRLVYTPELIVDSVAEAQIDVFDFAILILEGVGCKHELQIFHEILGALTK